MADNEQLKKMIEAVTARSGFTREIGVEVTAVTPGAVTMQVAKTPATQQFNGHFHGGIIAGLADHAAGAAVTTALPDGRIAVTIDLQVNYVAPASGPRLIAKAATVQAGGTIGTARVDLFSADGETETLCAIATATMRVVSMPG